MCRLRPPPAAVPGNASAAYRPLCREANGYAAANVDPLAMRFVLILFPTVLAAKCGGMPGAGPTRGRTNSVHRTADASACRAAAQPWGAGSHAAHPSLLQACWR